MTFSIQEIAIWEYIKIEKQHIAELNNGRENLKQSAHKYQSGDFVLLRIRT